MLVLSRQRNERILVGDDIVLQILEIRGNKVRVGITAPGNVKVLRDEIVSDDEIEAITSAAKSPR